MSNVDHQTISNKPKKTARIPIVAKENIEVTADLILAKTIKILEYLLKLRKKSEVIA